MKTTKLLLCSLLLVATQLCYASRKPTIHQGDSFRGHQSVTIRFYDESLYLRTIDFVLDYEGNLRRAGMSYRTANNLQHVSSNLADQTARRITSNPRVIQSIRTHLISPFTDNNDQCNIESISSSIGSMDINSNN